MSLTSQRLLIEARTLARCCYENVIWMAALADSGSVFVEEMLKDDAANRTSLAEMTLKLSSRAGASLQSENAKLLRDGIKSNRLRWPEAKKISASQAALGRDAELTYLVFQNLSLQAVHPSVTALGRHISRVPEGEKVVLCIDVVPDTGDGEHVRTIAWCVDAMYGVIIGTNQILGGTSLDDEIRESFERVKEFTHGKI